MTAPITCAIDPEAGTARITAGGHVYTVAPGPTMNRKPSWVVTRPGGHTTTSLAFWPAIHYLLNRADRTLREAKRQRSYHDAEAAGAGIPLAAFTGEE